MRRQILTVVFVLVISNSYAQTPIRLGLNFPFRNPELTSIDNYMSHIEGSGAQLFRQMTYADLIWSQVEPLDSIWHFDYADSIFLNYPEYEFVANLYCFSTANSDTNNFGYQVPWRAEAGTAPHGWNYLADSVATIDYLTTCINRYSSDVKYWELGNESENSNYPLGIPNIDFIDFAQHNYGWIKGINPQVKVLLPGTLGTYDVPLQSKYNWYRTVFSNGIGNYFDVFSFHDYNAWWTTPIHIDSILAIRDFYGLQSKECWITESSVSSLNDSISPNYVSIDEQAADVWRRTTIAWAKGINTFVWHGCWSSGMPSEWAEFGILDYTGKKKKSFHSFKLLSDEIIEFTSVVFISQGIAVDDNNSSTGGNGAWVIKFVVNGENKYVMWSRNNQTFQLSPATNTKYRITHVVPDSITLDGENVFYTTDSVNVNSGSSHTFNLASLPILVEEINNTSLPSITDENGVKIYPNPTNSDIEIINTLNHLCEFELYDINGKMILKTNLNPYENRKVSLIGISQGICIYKVKYNNNHVQEGKIVIE